jgi:hypothetical protein
MVAPHDPNVDSAKKAYQKIPARENRQATVNLRLKLKNDKKGAYYHKQQAQERQSFVQHLRNSFRGSAPVRLTAGGQATSVMPSSATGPSAPL